MPPPFPCSVAGRGLANESWGGGGLEPILTTDTAAITEWSSSFNSLWWNFRTIYGARNRVRIGLSYQPARLHWIAESIPWNLFLGIDSLVSIPGILKGLKMPYLVWWKAFLVNEAIKTGWNRYRPCFRWNLFDLSLPMSRLEDISGPLWITLSQWGEREKG